MDRARFGRHLGRLARFVRRPVNDQLLAMQAFVLLGVSRWKIKRRGLKAVQPGLGERMVESSATMTPEQAAEAQRIAWAINGVCIYTPWLSNCFPQAVTAQHLLRKRGIHATVYFGTNLNSADNERVVRDAGLGSDQIVSRFAAHAWVRAGSSFITGGDGHTLYSPIVWFGQPPLE